MESTTPKSSLEIYGDLLSQPMRSIIAFCKLNRIPYEYKPINIAIGEHLTEEYEKINPYKKIPAIILKTKEKEFNLAESCAIIKFLSDYNKVDEKWYPRQDVFRRALIDQWLDWHHNNTRFAAMNYVFSKVFKPLFDSRGLKTSAYETYKFLLKVLNFLNNILKERKFIVDDYISIADLIITSELNQLILTDFDFSKFSYVKEYMDRINSIKELEEVNENLLKFKTRINKKHSNAKF